MARAVRLAERGRGTTHPNPCVGCVIAHGETIVGEGWHERTGAPHAEVHALAAAGERARGATAYVSLEPCAHHGRTPPCADALVRAGVERVVVAHEDPFPDVSGAGIARLRAAGITVDVGVLAAAAEALNAGFLSRVRRGRPYVRVKLAASLDGRTALENGESAWITGEAARADVQQWRSRASCLLTGIGTVLFDDPRLDVRLAGRETPVRYVLDSEGRFPEDARMIGRGPIVLLIGEGAATPRAASNHADVTAYALPRGADGHVSLPAVMALLAERGENEVHVEAGATVAGSLLAADLVDELLLYIAPHVLGPGRGLFALPALEAMAGRRTFSLTRVDRVGTDLRVTCLPESFRPSAE